MLCKWSLGICIKEEEEMQSVLHRVAKKCKKYGIDRQHVTVSYVNIWPSQFITNTISRLTALKKCFSHPTIQLSEWGTVYHITNSTITAYSHCKFKELWNTLLWKVFVLINCVFELSASPELCTHRQKLESNIWSFLGRWNHMVSSTIPTTPTPTV